jgi:hypothetical protein
MKQKIASHKSFLLLFSTLMFFPLIFLIVALKPPSSNIGVYYALFTWFFLVFLPSSIILFALYAAFTLDDMINIYINELIVDVEESYLDNQNFNGNGLNM